MGNKCNGVFVIKKSKESADDLIKEFKKKFKNSKILQRYKEKEFFTKPSKLKREKHINSKIRKQKFLESLDN